MTNRAAAVRYARALFDVAVAERADLDRIDAGSGGGSPPWSRATRARTAR